jgi:phosphopantothenoylcysteine synthetase/decarboxylase
VTKSGIGFGSDNNEVTLIDPSGNSKHIPEHSKDEIAHMILDAVIEIVKKKRKIEDDWL